MGTEYRYLHARYNAYDTGLYNWTGIDAESGAPIPAFNGCYWRAWLLFEYKGDAGWVTLGCDLTLGAGELATGGDSRVWWTKWLDYSADWTKISSICPLNDAGVWKTNLANDRRVDTVKWIAEGGTLRLSDGDTEVFYQFSPEVSKISDVKTWH